MSPWIHWVATGFGAGYSPVAPGTAGSLVGLVPVFLLNSRPFLYIALLLGVFVLGVYCADRMERATGKKDDRRVVIDEIAGMMCTGLLIPPGIVYGVGGFVLFRILDILKPFPARWVERHFQGGWGIMLDDVVAGLYANLILQGLSRLLHSS